MQMNEALEELKGLYDTIPSKDFKEKPIGYDKREVDEYLDSICDVMANVIEAAQEQQNQPAAHAANAVQPVKPAAAPTVQAVKASATPKVDTAEVQEVLAAAVRLKNEIIAEAQSKADTIVADAEKQAKERLGSLTEEQDRLQKQVDELKKAAAEYRGRFEALLQQQQQVMDSTADLF